MVFRQVTLAINFEREDRHRAALHNVCHVGSPYLSGNGQKRRPFVLVSSLPIAENGEKDFGQATKRQACTGCLLLDHISRYGS